MNEVPEDVSAQGRYDRDQLRQQLLVCPVSSGLTGVIVPPSDKSVTHRALFWGALNQGQTSILYPSTAVDCRSTLELVRRLGYRVDEYKDVRIDITACDVPHQSEVFLDCGNSGTTARLACGFLTGEQGSFTLTGDDSLMRRPMERVARPLAQLGAMINTTRGQMPITIQGEGGIRGDRGNIIDVASAQVHAALMLAGLRSQYGVRLRRTAPMRDHSLHIARYFGLSVESVFHDGYWYDHVMPAIINRSIEIMVPGDFSSAAFFIAAALLVPGSDVTLHNVGINPTRTAFLQTLVKMGADIEIEPSEPGAEPVGRIQVRYTPVLNAITLNADSVSPNVAEMMDELPLLALVASQAHGTTTIHGASELRVKESDRIAATASLLEALGVTINQYADGFSITGPQKIRGGEINHHNDHRICMVAAIAGLIADQPVLIPDPHVVSVSYPNFWSDLQSVGVAIDMKSGEE